MENVPLDQIYPNPYQPRLSYDRDYIQALAADIALKRLGLPPERMGLLQVPMARRVGDRIELSFGHCRFEAFKYNQNLYLKYPAQVYDQDFSVMPLETLELTDKQMYQMAAAENGKRNDLNPIEKACSIKRGVDEFGMTLEQAAEAHGHKARSTASNLVRLLELPEEIKAMVAAGSLPEKHARELLPLVQVAKNPAEAILLARRAIGEDWSASRVSEYVAFQMAQLLVRIDAKIAHHTDWPGDLPAGCQPGCAGCGWLVTWKHDLHCAKPGWYREKQQLFAAWEEQKREQERAARCETRYCPHCNHGQEFDGNQLYKEGSNRTCESCGQSRMMGQWLSMPRAYRPLDLPPAPLSIWQVEQKVRSWLADPDEPVDLAGQIEMLSVIKAGEDIGKWYLEQIKETITEKCLPGYLHQACNNVLEQLKQQQRQAADSGSDATTRIESEVDHLGIISSSSGIYNNGSRPDSGQEAEYRQTPPGQPTVADLAKVGYFCLSSYSVYGGGRIVSCSQHGTEGHLDYTIAYVSLRRKPRKDGTYGEPEGWINDLVAVDGRILHLIKSNSDEVWIFADEAAFTRTAELRQKLDARLRNLAPKVCPAQLEEFERWVSQAEVTFSQENIATKPTAPTLPSSLAPDPEVITLLDESWGKVLPRITDTYSADELTKNKLRGIFFYQGKRYVPVVLSSQSVRLVEVVNLEAYQGEVRLYGEGDPGSYVGRFAQFEGEDWVLTDRELVVQRETDPAKEMEPNR